MAAGGLAAALNGSKRQAESAAEIGMEHNLDREPQVCGLIGCN
jgi:L-serine deaminase